MIKNVFRVGGSLTLSVFFVGCIQTQIESQISADVVSDQLVGSLEQLDRQLHANATFLIRGDTDLFARTCSQFMVRLVSLEDLKPVPAKKDIVLDLSNTGAGNIVSYGSECKEKIDSITLKKGASEVAIFYKNSSEELILDRVHVSVSDSIRVVDDLRLIRTSDEFYFSVSNENDMQQPPYFTTRGGFIHNFRYLREPLRIVPGSFQSDLLLGSEGSLFSIGSFDIETDDLDYEGFDGTYLGILSVNKKGEISRMGRFSSSVAGSFFRGVIDENDRVTAIMEQDGVRNIVTRIDGFGFDSSFGASGKFVYDRPNVTFTAMEKSPSGDVLVAGVVSERQDEYSPFVLEINEDGVLKKEIGDSGVLEISLNFYPKLVHRQLSGRIILAGLDATLKLEDNPDIDGFPTAISIHPTNSKDFFKIGSLPLRQVPPSQELNQQFFLQPDEKIVLTSVTSSDFQAGRFHLTPPNPSELRTYDYRDMSFGSEGRFNVDFSGFDFVTMTMDHSGRMVTCGNVDGDATLAILNSDGSGSSTIVPTKLGIGAEGCAALRIRPNGVGFVASHFPRGIKNNMNVSAFQIDLAESLGYR